MCIRDSRNTFRFLSHIINFRYNFSSSSKQGINQFFNIWLDGSLPIFPIFPRTFANPVSYTHLLSDGEALDWAFLNNLVNDTEDPESTMELLLDSICNWLDDGWVLIE